MKKYSSTYPLRVNDHIFEAVDEFKYFGTIITSKNDIGTEIDSLLVMANKCYFG